MSRITIILSFFLACLGTNIQAQEPYWQQTSGPGGQIDKLVFDSSENMYAVGDRVWRSTDEGNTWKEITPTLTPPLKTGEHYRVAVSPEGIIYAGEGIDEGGASSRPLFYLLRSKDKGETWEIIRSDYVSVNICALSDGKVFLSGWKSGNRSEKCFQISSDNGAHWTEPSGVGTLPKTPALHISHTLNGALFLDFKSDPYFYRSTDGGQNWIKLVNSAVAGNGLISGPDNTLYTGNNTSSDNGRTWMPRGQVLNFYPQSVALTSTNEIYAIDDQNLAYSQDGVSWKYVLHTNSLIVPRFLYSNYHGTKIFMLHYKGVIQVAPDSAALQIKDVPSSYVYTVFPDVDGQVICSSSKSLTASTDSGYSWELQGVVFSRYIRDNVVGGPFMRFIRDSSGGLLVKYGPEVIRSTNNGKKWDFVLKQGLLVERLVTAASGSIFLLSEVNGVFRTTDMGLTWDMMDISSRKPASIDCQRNGNIFITAGSAIMRSTNNGNDWQNIFELTGYNTSLSDKRILSAYSGSLINTSDDEIIVGYQISELVDSTFVNGSWKYITSGKSGVIRSIDNGITWNTVNEGLNGDHLKEMAAGPNGDVYGLAASTARVVYLKKGESSWTDISSGVNAKNDLNSIVVASDGTAYIGTWGRGVFRKGKVVNSVDDTKQPTQHTSVLAVYPNPVASHTSIAYSLRDNSYVELSLFDALGREIVNYVKKSQIAGDYQVDANLFNLDAGIYFVKLVTSHGSVVEKVIVTK